MEVLSGTGEKKTEIIILKGGSRYLSHYGTAGEMRTFRQGGQSWGWVAQLFSNVWWNDSVERTTILKRLQCFSTMDKLLIKHRSTIEFLSLKGLKGTNRVLQQELVSNNHTDTSLQMSILALWTHLKINKKMNFNAYARMFKVYTGQETVHV